MMPIFCSSLVRIVAEHALVEPTVVEALHQALRLFFADAAERSRRQAEEHGLVAPMDPAEPAPVEELRVAGRDGGVRFVDDDHAGAMQPIVVRLLDADRELGQRSDDDLSVTFVALGLVVRPEATDQQSAVWAQAAPHVLPRLDGLFAELVALGDPEDRASRARPT